MAYIWEWQGLNGVSGHLGLDGDGSGLNNAGDDFGHLANRCGWASWPSGSATAGHCRSYLGVAWSGQGSPGLPGRVHSWPPWQLQGCVGGRILKGSSTVNFVKHGIHFISALFVALCL